MQWQQLLSRARLGSHEAPRASSARTDFQRDFDRVVFSSAFRRMQDKTQVFPLSKVDYVRTRLTHSLEASSIGRSLGTLGGERVIARHGLDDFEAADFGAIVAAACLAHDIGNPPFGHSGEDAIRHWAHEGEYGARRVAIIGDGGETALAGDAHPGAALLQVAPCQQLRVFLPEAGCRGGAGVKLVPVGGYYQRVVRVRSPGNCDQAHAAIIAG